MGTAFTPTFFLAHWLLFLLPVDGLGAQETDLSSIGVDRDHLHNPWALGSWSTKPSPCWEENKHFSWCRLVGGPFLGYSCSTGGRMGSFPGLECLSWIFSFSYNKSYIFLLISYCLSLSTLNWLSVSLKLFICVSPAPWPFVRGGLNFSHAEGHVYFCCMAAQPW